MLKYGHDIMTCWTLGEKKVKCYFIWLVYAESKTTATEVLFTFLQVRDSCIGELHCDYILMQSICFDFYLFVWMYILFLCSDGFRQLKIKQ